MRSSESICGKTFSTMVSYRLKMECIFYRDSYIFVEKMCNASEYNGKSEIGFKLGIRFLILCHLYLHSKTTNCK